MHIVGSQDLSQHRNALGFLRLLFASLVIVSHVPEIVDGNASREPLTRLFGTITFGELAVDGFFIISGCLISTSYLNSSSLRRYLVKRIVRIYPAFLVCSLLCMTVIAPLGGADLGSQSWRFYLKAAVHSLTLNPPDNPGAFAGTNYAELNAAMWSIRYEFRCYLLVVALGFAGMLGRSALLAVAAVVLIALSPMVSDDPAIGPAWLHTPLWLGSPSESMKLAGMFLAGAAFRGIGQRRAPSIDRMLLAAVILAAALSVPSLASLGVATAGTYLIFGISTLGRGTVLERINNENDISYGLYLYAWPVEKLLIQWGLAAPLWLLGCCVWIMAAALGAASWHGVEKPSLRLSQRRRAARPVAGNVGNLTPQF